MKRMTQWIGRASAALTGAILAVMLPVAAWAHATPGVKEAVEVGGILAKYRPRSRSGGGIGLFGFLGAGCCLVVVIGIIVLIVVLVKRNK